MAAETDISWADASWPVTVGCEKVSAGCYGCYAMRDARRMGSNPNPKVSSVYSGLVEKQPNGLLNWTGVVRELPQRLNWPAKWHEHRDIFVCSQSDLFHDSVSDEFIGRVFSAMWNNPQHTYYVLTKRPERLLALLSKTPPDGLQDFNSANFPHVIFGISAEDQKAANERMPLLVQVPLHPTQRFVSAEPLIGKLDLSRWIKEIGWVIAGGESGSSAKPMFTEWPRLLRDQCEAANVAFHFKQWGEYLPEPLAKEHQPIAYTEGSTLLYRAGSPKATAKTPVIIGSDGTQYYRVGRKKAGRVLDGEYWNARPGKDVGPVPAPHPIGSTVMVTDTASRGNGFVGGTYDGLIGTIEIIQPDDPDDQEFAGEEATYYLQVTEAGETRHIQQAFSYWQLEQHS